MKAFVLIRMVDGVPDVDRVVTPFHGFVLCDKIPTTNWAAYLVAGSGAQLLALDALPQVLGILAFTQTEDLRWGPDMDNVLPPAVRTRINNWLSNHNQPNVPAGWTYKQFIIALFRRLNPHFRLADFDISEA